MELVIFSFSRHARSPGSLGGQLQEHTCETLIDRVSSRRSTFPRSNPSKRSTCKMSFPTTAACLASGDTDSPDKGCLTPPLARLPPSEDTTDRRAWTSIIHSRVPAGCLFFDDLADNDDRQADTEDVPMWLAMLWGGPQGHAGHRQRSPHRTAPVDLRRLRVSLRPRTSKMTIEDRSSMASKNQQVTQKGCIN